MHLTINSTIKRERPRYQQVVNNTCTPHICRSPSVEGERRKGNRRIFEEAIGLIIRSFTKRERKSHSNLYPSPVITSGAT